MKPWLRRDEGERAGRLPADDTEIQEEIALHIELLIRDRIAEGLSRAEAERAARRRFGDRRKIAGLCRDAYRSERSLASTWLRGWALAVAVGGLVLAAEGPRGGPRLLGTWTGVVAVLFYLRVATPLALDGVKGAGLAPRDPE